jgi:hypothetical protein
LIVAGKVVDSLIDWAAFRFRCKTQTDARAHAPSGLGFLTSRYLVVYVLCKREGYGGFIYASVLIKQQGKTYEDDARWF